jgi:hypothetical protein
MGDTVRPAFAPLADGHEFHPQGGSHRRTRETMSMAIGIDLKE